MALQHEIAWNLATAKPECRLFPKNSIAERSSTRETVLSWKVLALPPGIEGKWEILANILLYLPIGLAITVYFCSRRLQNTPIVNYMMRSKAVWCAAIISLSLLFPVSYFNWRSKQAYKWNIAHCRKDKIMSLHRRKAATKRFTDRCDRPTPANIDLRGSRTRLIGITRDFRAIDCPDSITVRGSSY